jgi:hypothetical protein
MKGKGKNMKSASLDYRTIYDNQEFMKKLFADTSITFTPTKTRIKANIKDYKVIEDKVVIVTFTDGTTEKAVCSPEDKFDLERAIEICVCKKIFGGTKAYNNAIKDALKQIVAIDKKKKADADEAERIAKKKAKEIDRKNRRKERNRQAKIDIQAEAFLKAMQMYDDYIVNTVVEEPTSEINTTVSNTSAEISDTADKE